MTRPYRAQSLDRRLYGVFSGIVEDNDDPEHEGRVTLRFPWLDDATVSGWCRVVQPYAGPGFGAVFVPEKQCEVLVAFVHGDMTEPIVLGGLFNGVDKPPAFHHGTDQDIKLIRTKAGHVLRLDDSAGARAIELATAGGHQVELDDQAARLTISTAGKHRIALDDRAQTIEIHAGGGVGKVTIDATGNITIEGGSITARGSAIALSAPHIDIG